MFKGKNRPIIKEFLRREKTEFPQRFSAERWEIIEAIMHEEFQNVDLSHQYSKPTKDITVVGRNGAGKSTFVQNFHSSPLFGNLYEIDNDRYPIVAEKHGVWSLGMAALGASELSDFIMNFLDYVDVPTVITSAGSPAGADFGRDRNWSFNQADIIHLFLCDTAVAVDRIKRRMIAGGHPRNFEDRMIFSQTSYIIAVNEFIEKSRRLIVWDSTTNEAIYPLATCQTGMDNGKNIVLHRADGLAGFGHDKISLGMLISLGRTYSDITRSTLSGAVSEVAFKKRGKPDDRFLTKHNERFDPALFLDQLTILWSERDFADIGNAVAESRQILEGPQQPIDGVTIRTANDDERLPPLNPLQSWRGQTAAMSRYEAFFAEAPLDHAATPLPASRSVPRRARRGAECG